MCENKIKIKHLSEMFKSKSKIQQGGPNVPDGCEAIINKKEDARIKNTKSQKFPYNSIGLLEIILINQNGTFTSIIGSAFLISPNIIITAAHNVHYPHASSTKLYFHPKLQSTLSFSHSRGKAIPIIEWKTCSQYHHTQKSENDFAVGLLQRRIVQQKYLMFAENCPKVEEIQIFGYPFDRNHYDNPGSYCQFGAKGISFSIQNGEISYAIDTNKGQSGSPILTEINKEWYVLGNHSKSGEDQLNKGCYYSSHNIQNIFNIIDTLLQRPKRVVFPNHPDQSNTNKKDVKNLIVKKKLSQLQVKYQFKDVYLPNNKNSKVSTDSKGSFKRKLKLLKRKVPLSPSYGPVTQHSVSPKEEENYEYPTAEEFSFTKQRSKSLNIYIEEQLNTDY